MDTYCLGSVLFLEPAKNLVKICIHFVLEFIEAYLCSLIGRKTLLVPSLIQCVRDGGIFFGMVDCHCLVNEVRVWSKYVWEESSRVYLGSVGGRKVMLDRWPINEGGKGESAEPKDIRSEAVQIVLRLRLNLKLSLDFWASWQSPSKGMDPKLTQC